MMQTSKQEVWAFFRDWWNYVESIGMALVLWTTTLLSEELVESTYLPIIFALTIGLLWIKMIGFLKNINMQLSTFILAVVEILKDMRWFLLVMTVVILMFGEMIEILMKTSGTCKVGLDQGERLLSGAEDFCSSLAWDSYVRIYGIIVGDVSLEDFQETTAITVLFIIFTLFCVVVLLNILIAIVNDSYAKSLARSYGLFGKARVEHVSRQLARERFVSTKIYLDIEDSTKRNFSNIVKRCLFRVLRWCIFAFLLAVVIAVNVLSVDTWRLLWLDRHKYGGEAAFLCVSLVCALSLFNGGLFAMSLYYSGEVLKKSSWFVRLKSIFLLRLITGLFLLPLKLFFKLIGMKGDAILGGGGGGSEDDEWSGRISYLEEETRNIVGESEGRIRAELRREIRALQTMELWNNKEKS